MRRSHSFLNRQWSRGCQSPFSTLPVARSLLYQTGGADPRRSRFPFKPPAQPFDGPATAPRLRAGTDRLPLTHEFIAMMMGVRRAGITVVAQSLKSARLNRSVHGCITIADREGLAVAACECYEVTKREYARLLGADSEDNAPAKVLEFGDQRRN